MKKTKTHVDFQEHKYIWQKCTLYFFGVLYKIHPIQKNVKLL